MLTEQPPAERSIAERRPKNQGVARSHLRIRTDTQAPPAALRGDCSKKRVFRLNNLCQSIQNSNNHAT
jgi:hypothetical protein